MAIKKRQASVEAGAPAWMVTYGDLVTLLLTFFVMLLAMSEVKKDERFIEFMQAIKEAFGYVGGIRNLPLEDVEVPKNVELARLMIVPPNPHDLSESPDRGLRGKRSSVKDIRRGNRFVKGGKVLFAPVSATLAESELAKIAELAEMLAGFTTFVEVRGYCSRIPVDDSEFEDHFALSFARARAVAQALQQAGMDPNRIILVAAGTTQPVHGRAYTPADRRQNDLVEILQLDQQVDEFRP